MKKLILYFLLLMISVSTYAQNEKDKLIELGKAYKNFMFVNNPPKDFIKSITFNTPSNLEYTTNFIIETINSKTKILDKKFLTLPDEQTLKYIYVIRQINYNIHDKEPISNEEVVTKFLQKDIPRNELVDGYYGMLFTAYGNKVKPFNMSKVNFQLNEYNLKNDTEKGIFYLRCMEFCGKNIWGLINIAKPMNTKGAYDYIQKYPKFNGLEYYQYQDFNFPDFEMVIIKDKPVQSYKEYYIDKLYEILLNHILCIKKENKPDSEYNEVLLGSILRDSDYYKYSKNKKTLEGLFKQVKADKTTMNIDSLRLKADSIVAEGKKLYRLEKASWLGTDIFLENYSNRENLGGYFSYEQNDTVKNIFISRDDKPKIIGFTEFPNGEFDDISKAKFTLGERDLNEIEKQLVLLRDSTISIIQKDTIFKYYNNTNYNIIPTIGKDENLVYILTAPTVNGIVIFGNDYLLTFSKDNTLKKIKQLHQNIIPLDNKEDRKVIMTMHSHTEETGSLITATDICTLMLYSRYAGWEKHYVVSKNIVCEWDCINNKLKVMTQEEFDNMFE